MCMCPQLLAAISQRAADEVTALLQATVLGRSVVCLYHPPTRMAEFSTPWWPLGAAIETTWWEGQTLSSEPTSHHQSSFRLTYSCEKDSCLWSLKASAQIPISPLNTTVTWPSWALKWVEQYLPLWGPMGTEQSIQTSRADTNQALHKY